MFPTGLILKYYKSVQVYIAALFSWAEIIKIIV